MLHGYTVVFFGGVSLTGLTPDKIQIPKLIKKVEPEVLLGG